MLRHGLQTCLVPTEAGQGREDIIRCQKRRLCHTADRRESSQHCIAGILQEGDLFVTEAESPTRGKLRGIVRKLGVE